MTTVDRLSAVVRLIDPAETLARAEAEAEAGDELWKQWLEEYECGEAIIVRLEVRLEVSNGGSQVIELANRGVFIEKDTHPPKVEQQVAGLVSKDFPALASRLSDDGHRVDRYDLAEMYVHVELDEAVLSSLAERGGRAREARPGGPDSDAGLSDQEDVS